MAVPSLFDYISQHYQIENEPLTHDVEETDIFLLGEHHEICSHWERNTAFIDLFASDSSPILIEAEKSGELIDQKTNRQSAFLKREFKVYGWDKEKFPDCLAKTPEVLSRMEEIRNSDIEFSQKIMANLKSGDSSENFEILTERLKIQRENMKFYSEHQLFVPMINWINEAYSERNATMIKTIADFSGPGKETAFLISGWSHLSKSFSSLSFVPIDLGDDLLKGIKITILIPK